MNLKASRQRIQSNNSQEPLILVLEDDPDNLLFLAHTLILLKYNFITATEGQTAYDLATKYNVDLILLDLVLSDINGFELVSLLKKNQLTQAVPIIAISALVRNEDRERAIAVGCDDYLHKPYLIEDLDGKIRQYLPKSPLIERSQFSLFSVS